MPKMDAGSQKMMRSPDIKFAMMAAQGGMAEVQMGKLAAEKGSDADVKAFGQQMVDDHTKAGDQLKSVAAKQNVSLPSTLTPKDQATFNKLSSLSDAAFDKAYVADMVKDHEMDVKDFEKESATGKDDAIKGFATETLPTLKGHLDKIKSIQAKMKGGM